MLVAHAAKMRKLVTGDFRKRELNHLHRERVIFRITADAFWDAHSAVTTTQERAATRSVMSLTVDDSDNDLCALRSFEFFDCAALQYRSQVRSLPMRIVDYFHAATSSRRVTMMSDVLQCDCRAVSF